MSAPPINIKKQFELISNKQTKYNIFISKKKNNLLIQSEIIDKIPIIIYQKIFNLKK